MGTQRGKQLLPVGKPGMLSWKRWNLTQGFKSEERGTFCLYAPLSSSQKEKEERNYENRVSKNLLSELPAVNGSLSFYQSHSLPDLLTSICFLRSTGLSTVYVKKEPQST